MIDAADLWPHSDYDYLCHPSISNFVPQLRSSIVKAAFANEALSRKHFLPVNYKKKHGTSNLLSRSDVKSFVKEKPKTTRPILTRHGTNRKLDNSISGEDARIFLYN